MNFGLLTAEICWRVWGTPADFNGFRVLVALLHSISGRRQTAALNRGRHLYSAGGPSRWHWPTFLVYPVAFFLSSSWFFPRLIDTIVDSSYALIMAAL